MNDLTPAAGGHYVQPLTWETLKSIPIDGIHALPKEQVVNFLKDFEWRGDGNKIAMRAPIHTEKMEKPEIENIQHKLRALCYRLLTDEECQGAVSFMPNRDIHICKIQALKTLQEEGVTLPDETIDKMKKMESGHFRGRPPIAGHNNSHGRG